MEIRSKVSKVYSIYELKAEDYNLICRALDTCADLPNGDYMNEADRDACAELWKRFAKEVK